jgi:glutathione S-transferase
MRLFYGSASPYARMVHVTLLETGIDGQVRKQEVTLRDPGSALLPFNPVGRVPTLELDDGTILTESLLILNYLDTLHSGPPLLLRDGSDRGALSPRWARQWGCWKASSLGRVSCADLRANDPPA